MHFLYLLVNLFSLHPTLLFSFHPKIRFYLKWPLLFPSILSTTSLFVIWDMYYTHLGVWGFNQKYLIGYATGNLPVKEVLFFLCIPYACLFTYYCLGKFIQTLYFKKAEKTITLLLISGLSILSACYYPKLYTSVTFLLLAVMLFLLKFVFKVTWLHRFYFAYLFLLIPFMIINGILTGTGLERPVVWYNPEEIIGLRILSIPVEDIFYGMLMLICSVSIFEFLQKDNENKSF